MSSEAARILCGNGRAMIMNENTDGDRRRLMIATLHYHGILAKVDGAWLFAERQLHVGWLEERTLS